MRKGWTRTEKREFFPLGNLKRFFDRSALTIDSIPRPATDDSVFLPIDQLRQIKSLGIQLCVEWEPALAEVGAKLEDLKVRIIARDRNQKRFQLIESLRADEVKDDLFELLPQAMGDFSLASGLELALALTWQQPGGRTPVVCARRSFHLRPEESAFEFPQHFQSNQWFADQGLSPMTPWYLKVSDGIDFAGNAGDYLSLNIHENLKPMFERVKGTPVEETVVKSMLVDSMRVLALIFAEEGGDGEYPERSIGSQIQGMLSEANVTTSDLKGSNASKHQQRLTSWISQQVDMIDTIRRIRVAL